MSLWQTVVVLVMLLPRLIHGYSRSCTRPTFTSRISPRLSVSNAHPQEKTLASNDFSSHQTPPDLIEFRRLGLMEPLIQSLKESKFEEPSPIQHAAIPEALHGRNLAFAATTGSGKTLAYLLPVIQAIKTAELLEAETDRLTKRPRALVLVPTRELAEQVLRVAKQLAHHAKFRSCMIVGGDDYGKQRRLLEGVLDLVVACPGRLLKHRELGHFHLSRATHIVIDEVDTMLIQGFGPDIKNLLAPILFSPQRRDDVQFIVATATMTNAVRKLLNDGDLPPCRLLETSDLGQSVPTASHRFLVAGGSDKLTMLKDLCLGHASHSVRSKRTMVFCNTVQSCRAAQHCLTEAGLSCLGYHGEMNSGARQQSLAKFQDGEGELLVCTDLAARGLDLPDVDHVVMFDFPMNPVDYLHRAGRTARFGRKGMVTSLVTKRDVTLASAIERAVGRGEPLDQLSNDRRDYLPSGRLAKQSPSSPRDMASAAGRIKAEARKSKRPPRSNGARRGEGRGRSTTTRAEGSTHDKKPSRHGGRGPSSSRH